MSHSFTCYAGILENRIASPNIRRQSDSEWRFWVDQAPRKNFQGWQSNVPSPRLTGNHQA